MLPIELDETESVLFFWTQFEFRNAPYQRQSSKNLSQQQPDTSRLVHNFQIKTH